MSELINQYEKQWTPWLKARAQAPVEKIMSEYRGVWELAVPHRMDYSQGWYSLTLHGMKPQWTEAINQYEGFEDLSDMEAPYVWTSAANQMPETVSFLKSLPYQKFYRVRFMLLAPGGSINLHQDNEKSHLRALNIAITQPKECSFKFYTPQSKDLIGKVPFEEGDAYFVNIGMPHEVKNESLEWRIHMIVHGQFTQDFYKNTQNYLET